MAQIPVAVSVSPSSLTISGTTQVSATISWTFPTLPEGSTITSCLLSGTATASMSKGSATLTLDGMSITSGSSFYRDVGAKNSATIAAIGGNKNASGTVTFSNLTCTIVYETISPQYTVTFMDWDGTILKTEEVEAGGSATAPSNPTREGYNFIGWNTNFSNVTSDLTVTALYQEISNKQLKVKENGLWVPITSVYKKINNSWIIQNDIEPLFSSTRYVRGEIIINPDISVPEPDDTGIPTAVLYSDGTLVFSNNENTDSSLGKVRTTYTGWDKEEYQFSGDVPWKDNQDRIIKVYFNVCKATSMRSWFYYFPNLTEIDFGNFYSKNVTSMELTFYMNKQLTSILNLEKLDTSNVTMMRSTFLNCSSLSSINVSNFNTSKVVNMQSMFSGCSSLTTLDLSSFDMSNVTNNDGMFYGCTNLQTIYARTEADAEKFRTSTNFPANATVIVGKPN